MLNKGVDDRGRVFLWAYAYDRTGAFTRAIKVFPEYTALGETSFLLPYQSTALEPPETEAGHVAVFFPPTRDWMVLADHRGETWFDWKDTPVKIERPGNPEHWQLKRAPRVTA